MASKAELQSGGMHAALANRLGHDSAATVVPVGSNQATALQLTGSFALISSAAASTGVILPDASGQPMTMVFNGGANAVQLYGKGTQTINGIAAATGVSLPVGKAAMLSACNNQWIAIISA